MNTSVLLSWILAFAVATSIGYFVTAWLWSDRLSRSLIWAFAPGVGLGVCSLIFFFFRRPMFTVEFGLLVVMTALWFRSRKTFDDERRSRSGLPVIAMFVACAVGWVVSGMTVRVDRMPHGDVDAWNIWNSHARYLFRDGQAWQDNIKNTFHSDYPLLTSSLTARLWRYATVETPEAGGALGILFTLAGVAVLVGVLMELRDAALAMLVALILVATPFYIEHGVSQSADVPLSVYVLSTVALICLHFARAPDGRGLLVLAGLTAGFAGWTKNEGLLFIAAVSGALLLPVLFSPGDTLRRLSAFAAGLFLPLLAIVWFKWTIAPPNDITGYRNYAEVVQKILSPDRYSVILHSFSDTFWTFGDWVMSPVILLLVYVALRGLDGAMLRNPGWLQGVLVCVLVLAGYYAVYVVTPMDLRWHLDSSLPRLYHHIWPTFLLLAGLAGRGGLSPRQPFAESTVQ